MHILFAGGGTAGHINPALAVAGYIRERHPDATISFIGTAEKLESRLVPEAGYDFYTIDVAGFQRKLNFQNVKRNLSALRKVFVSSSQAKHLLRSLQPDVVMGTGGYVRPRPQGGGQDGLQNGHPRAERFPRRHH